MSNFDKYLQILKEEQLNEGKKEDFEKFAKVVKSCKTYEHIETAQNMGMLLAKKYGKNFIDDFKEFIHTHFGDWSKPANTVLNKIDKMIADRFEKMEFEMDQET